MTIWSCGHGPGDLRDDFDLDSTDYAWLVFGTKKGAAAFELTDDMNPGALKLPFGRSVTFVFQLVDDEGDPVFEEDVDIKVRDEEQIDDGEPKHHTTDDSTDESGQVYLTFRMGRPRSADDDTKAYLDLEIVNSSRLDVIDETTVTILDDNIRLVWDDTEAAPTSCCSRRGPTTGLRQERGAVGATRLPPRCWTSTVIR